MISRKCGSLSLTLKNFGSTLSIAYSSPDAAFKIPTTDPTENATLKHANRPTKTLNDAVQERSERSRRSLYTVNIHKPYEGQVSPGPCPAFNKLRSYLHSRDYISFLVELTLQSKMDENFGAKMFQKSDVTTTEFSAFIEGLLSERNLLHKLSIALPNVSGTEMVFSLYQLYLKTVTPGPLDPLQLHDLNKFIGFFIRFAQLRKAQTVLDCILKSNNNQLPCDSATATHYLQLRCGALPRNWKVLDGNLGRSTRLGACKNRHQLASHSYKALDNTSVLKFMNLLSDPTSVWFHRKSAALESAVVYSLGFMGQLKLLEDHVWKNWGISLKEQNQLSNIPHTSPSSEILVAILTSYASNKNISSALHIIDGFMAKYPNLDLDQLFWRRLFQWSTRVWSEKTDSRGELSRGCWKVMREWHAARNRPLPADTTLLNERFVILSRTNNYREAIEVVKHYYPLLFEKPELSRAEVALFQKFAKLILKNMAHLGYYHKPLKFIKEWSPNRSLEDKLRTYFDKHRKAYSARKQRKTEAAQKAQKRFDEEEEDSMLLGRLW
ncbi:LAQU0S03e02124g1_1 [Lachancea quebecensis]|uniref:ATPase expression protein 2, mitochondrial n=1 Tax=Lachancea quebecensis TaxID=1654605 RepID=A0A0P1KPG4_9SACH|nr:LAQU0S03e02124g1_1 [Lachancea quebecensis]